MDGLEQDRQLLKALCEFAGLTPSKLATEAGLAATTILRPYNGTATSRLSAPTLQKLQERFPEFTAWSDFGVIVPPNPNPEVRGDVVELREIDLQYGMGATYLDVPVTTEMRTFSREWLRGITKSPPEVLFWASGDGDSMEPTIRAGETFLIDTSQRTPRMNDGIWALALGEIGMVKRLSFQGGGYIELHSDNQLVRPMSVSEDELHIIGRVIAVVKRL